MATGSGSNFTTTPNMGLTQPTPGVCGALGIEPAGKSWLELLNSSLGTLDQHNHASGAGSRIPTAGLNINADLSFNANNATNLRTARFAAGFALANLTASDLGCLAVVSGDLYFVDGAGNQVRLTSSGGIAGTPGSISGLASPAAATYTPASKLFTLTSSSGYAAGLSIGPLTIGDASASGGKAVTLSAPSGLAANYGLTLPAALPGSTGLLTLSTAGALSTLGTVGGGLSITATSGDAITGQGQGGGTGLVGTGGTTGAGTYGVFGSGGGTSGTGVVGQGGTGSGTGVFGISGPSGGVGVQGKGGGGGGTGVQGLGTGSSPGVYGWVQTGNTGVGGLFQAVANDGLQAQGGGSGNGGTFTAGASGLAGVKATGASTGVGYGAWGIGGSAGGVGVVGDGGPGGTGSAHGGKFTGGGSGGNGVYATGGLGSDAIYAIGGSGGGRGATFSPSGGYPNIRLVPQASVTPQADGDVWAVTEGAKSYLKANIGGSVWYLAVNAAQPY